MMKLSYVVALHLLVVAVSPTAWAAESGGSAMEIYESPAPAVRKLSYASLALTEDGRHAAFARDEQMLFVELATAKAVSIPVPIAAQSRTNLGLSPAWSPDGDLLAVIQAGSVPGIWDRSSGQIVFESDRPICAVYCSHWAPVWTRDGRLLYVAEPAAKKRGAGTPNKPAASFLNELYGRTRPPEGVVVMQSNEAKEALGRIESKLSDDIGGPCFGGCQSSEIVAIDPQTKTLAVLATGAPIKGIFMADNGRFAIVAVAVPALPTQKLSRYYSYYVLPLDGKRTKARSSAASGPVDRDGNALRLLAANVPNWQVGRSASISPSGRYLAYTTTGVSADGDVHLVHVATGRQVNLTERVELPPNPFNSHPTKNVTGEALADFSGKFGSDYFAPLWSGDERAVLVMRPTLDKGALRYHLWRVPVSGGEAAPIGMNPDFSIESVAQCQRGHSGCLFGQEKAVLATLRMRQADGSDRLVVGAIDPANGNVSVIRDVGAIGAYIDYLGPPYDHGSASGGNFLISRDGRNAVALLNPTDAPPELWQVSVDGQGGPYAKPLNVLQTQPVPAIKVKRIPFTSSTGEKLAVRVELPADYREGERLPAVMVVYGAARASINPEFNGGKKWYDPLKDARYAVLLPDLPPVPTAGGPNCDYMASNALAALDAAATTGSIDPQRVGIAGHSWGGYSVFCITSRTDRFKAGLAAAGLSNFFSMGVEGVGRGGFRLLASFAENPWENPQWYVNESPGFRLDKLVTPLTIAYGMDDGIAINHHYEMFRGLSVLKRSVQLLGYNDSGHVELLDYKDFWQRAFEWFDLHLKVTPQEKSARPRAASNGS
jgi:hypothetical protein